MPTGHAYNLLDALVVNAPVGIAVWDLDLRYRRVNDALATINGVPAEDHLGRTPPEVLGTLGEQVADMLRRCAATGEAIVDQPLERTRPDGVTQYRQTTVFPVRGPDGEVAGLAGVVRDVTEQHAAEDERRRLLREALTSRAAAEAAQVRAERAYAEADAARRRTAFLGAAGDRLAAVDRDFETTLREVARVAVPAVADVCTFTLVDEGGVARRVAVAAADPGDEELAGTLGGRRMLRGDARGGTAEVLRTGRPLLIERLTPEYLDAAADDSEQRAALGELEVSSAVVAPLRVRGRTVGAVSLVRKPDREPYSEDDLRLGQSLAARVALAYENARLYRERSHIARTLQRSLLPSALPEIPGIELAARYRAAGEENEVGGDFYDVFRAGQDGWTVVIGDVAGKGAEAAAVTSLTRHTLRAAGLRDRTPIESLQLLNEALLADVAGAPRFTTVLLAHVRPDGDGAAVTLSTGGHLPPVVVRRDGPIQRQEVRGALVGGLDRAEFGACDLHLGAGDLLLLHTDGVTELRVPGRGGVRSGDEALEAVLDRHRGEPAADVVAAVERSAVELQGGDPRDDIALIALRPRA